MRYLVRHENVVRIRPQFKLRSGAGRVGRHRRGNAKQ